MSNFRGRLTLSLVFSLLLISVGCPSAWGQKGELTTEVGVLNVTPDDEAGLSIDPTVRDSSGDGVLRAGERATAELTLTNRADGPADGVTVWLAPTEGGDQIQLSSSASVGTSPPSDLPEGAVAAGRIDTVPAGETRSVSTDLRAANTLSGGPVTLAVAVRDEYGFAPEEPSTLTLQTEKGDTAAQEKPAAVAETDRPAAVDRDVPSTDMERPDAIAVVIGIKDYQHADVPSVDFALRDAQTMKEYLVRALGFREENVIMAENASGAQLRRIFGTESDPQGQLYNYVREGESEVFVYYSGHGAPDPESEKAYLLGADTNPNYMSINGYPVNQMYENLAKIPATAVTVALDACFSGVSESGQIVQNVSPAVLSVENPIINMENGLAFTAGAADQVSSWYPEKKHGLFTYYFLRGLRGDADADGNQAVTAKELEAYLTDEVPYRARRMHNREQVPQVVGRDKDRVLVRYADALPAEDRE